MDDEELDGERRISAPGPPPISQLRLFFLSIFWFTHMAQWSAVLFVLLPLQIVAVLGEDSKATHLSLIVMGGGAASLVAAPLFGTLSDRTTSQRGRRIPFVIIGGLGVICTLVGLAFSGLPELSGLWITLFVILQIFHSLATTPYSALIPDIVPRQQYGAASAYLTVMTLLGILSGVILTGLAIELTRMSWPGYIIMGALEAIGLVFMIVTVRERQMIRQLAPFSLTEYIRETLRPFRDRSFSLVFWTRLFMLTAQYVLLQFFQYYLRDVIGSPFAFFTLELDTTEQAYAFFLAVSLGGSVIAGLVAGVLSDRMSRKALIYASGAFQVAVIIAMVLVRSFTAITFLGFVLGCGTGLYVSVASALACDVLPSDEYARDLGVWGATSTVPQVIGAPVAGLMLDGFQTVGHNYGLTSLGYTVVFITSAVLIVIGTVPIIRIRERTRYPGLQLPEFARLRWLWTRHSSDDAPDASPSLHSLDSMPTGTPLNLNQSDVSPVVRLASDLSVVAGTGDTIATTTAADVPPPAAAAAAAVVVPATVPLMRLGSGAVTVPTPVLRPAALRVTSTASALPADATPIAGSARLPPPPRHVQIQPQRAALSVRDVEALMSRDETAMKSTLDL